MTTAENFRLEFYLTVSDVYGYYCDCVGYCSDDVWWYLAEGEEQNADENAFDKHESESPLPAVDGSTSPPLNHSSEEDEGPVEHDSYEDGDPAYVTAQLEITGDVDDAGGESHQIGEVEAPITENGSDSAKQRPGTALSHDGGMPADQENGEIGISSPSDTAGGDAESLVECSGTPKPDCGGGQGEAPFENDSDDAGDQMLLERDGKFRVVNTDDVMAEDEVRSRSSSESSDAALRVSSLSVKTSSGGSRGRSKRSSAQPPMPRSKSAVTMPERRRSVDLRSVTLLH